MLETEEAQETEREISRIIGGNLTHDDEDAVLAELAEIEALEVEALKISLPEAPSTVIETGMSFPLHSKRLYLLIDITSDQVQVKIADEEQDHVASTTKPKKASKHKNKKVAVPAV